MKKVFFVASCIFALTFISCDKQSTCTCTTTMDGEVMSTTTVQIDKGKCSDGNASVTSGGMTMTTTCK